MTKDHAPRPRPVSPPFILHALEDISDELRRQTSSRELSLASMKLQEAIMWLKAAIENANA